MEQIPSQKEKKGSKNTTTENRSTLKKKQQNSTLIQFLLATLVDATTLAKCPGSSKNSLIY